MAIDTLELLSGALPNRVLGLVLEWAALHRLELRDNWEAARHGEPLERIAGSNETECADGTGRASDTG